jgi:hypothetical protein
VRQLPGGKSVNKEAEDFGEGTACREKLVHIVINCRVSELTIV